MVVATSIGGSCPTSSEGSDDHRRVFVLLTVDAGLKESLGQFADGGLLAQKGTMHAAKHKTEPLVVGNEMFDDCRPLATHCSGLERILRWDAIQNGGHNLGRE